MLIDPDAAHFLSETELPADLKADFSLLLEHALSAIRQRAGSGLIKIINQISDISIKNYANPEKSLIELERLLCNLSISQKASLISGYSLIFHLLNSAEKLHICRINREREKTDTRKHTIAQAVSAVINESGSHAISEQINSLQIIPTITAHPTEARRLSVLFKLDEIAKNLSYLRQTDLTARESERFKNKILRSVILLSATSSLRDTKPDAIQEVHFALHYLSRTVWEIIPEIYSDFINSLPGQDIISKKAKIISFRSWIGGDRDGNPTITVDITRQALEILRRQVLKLYLNEVRRLKRDISISLKKAMVSPILLESIQKDMQNMSEKNTPSYLINEPYRIKFELISKKLSKTINQPSFYNAQEFLSDLEIIEESLNANGFRPVTHDSTLFRLLTRARTFGFHFASLDIRQHSNVHENVITEIFEASGICPDYKIITEEEKITLLEEQINSEKSSISNTQKLSTQAAELIGVFRLIAEVKADNPDAIQTYIISMTHSCSDMLEVLLLMKETGLRVKTKEGWKSNLNIVPLFETIEDLDNSKDLFETIVQNSTYRSHLKSMDDFQEIMLGYSDSNKDGGFLISNMLLNRSCLKLVYAAEKHKIRIGLFHGRGGTIARGGGRSVNAIRASSGSQSRGYIRFTEQGEVISFRYGLPALAHRHLEQIIHAMLTESAKPAQKLPPQANEELKKLADISVNTYRGLIQNKSFWEWYITTTPVEFISKLPIASRPVSRSTNEVNFDGLRAIPWGFAWNQSRFMVPSWYGVGSALENADLNSLKDNYSNDPLFKIILDSLELELARARPEIGIRYANGSDPAITKLITEEHKKTLEAVLSIKKQEKLLEGKQLIANLIKFRNRHLDAVHVIQRLLIEEFRADGRKNSEIEKLILESINTIAAALQTTG